MFMAVQMLKCNEETDCTDSGEYPQLEPLKNVLHQHPAGLVGLSLLQARHCPWCSLPSTFLPAPAAVGTGFWEQAGDVGSPRSTSKGAWVRKMRLCMTSYKAQAFEGPCCHSAGMFTYHKDSHCHWFSSFKCDNYSEFRLVGAVSFYVR